MSLVQELIRELIEGKPVALFGGGFKPPTRGHLEVVLQGLKENPEVKHVQILVGQGSRNNISQDESVEIWKMYQKFIPVPSEIIPVSSPFKYFKDYLTDHSDEKVYVFIGARPDNEDDDRDVAERSKYVKQYSDNVIPVKVQTKGGVSGTMARKAALSGNSKEFISYFPSQLSDSEKQEIIDMVSSIVKEQVDFKSLEQQLDDMFAELDIDVAFTTHFKERVIERGLTEEDILELANKIIDQYPDELDFIDKGQNIVMSHLSRLVDIAAVNTGYGDDYLKDLVFKTAFKRKDKSEPEFRTNASSPRLAVKEDDPKKGTGKKPKGSGRRLYTDEDPNDTVGVKFSSRQDIVDTLNKKSFKAKSHARQSQIINLIHQRVRAAYNRAKDPDVKKRLKTALDYAEQRKEASKAKTQRLKKQKLKEHSMGDSIDLLPYLSKLTQHMIDKGYKIEPLPGLELIDDDIENANDFLGKTAYYDPNTQHIVLYTHGRHPKDIARSYAHEMIHHMQNLEGRLGKITTTNTQEDDHLNNIEAEANLKGTMTFRNWTDSLNEIGDASAGAFPYNQNRIDIIVNTLKDKIDNQPDAKWRQHLLPFLKFSSPNADYEVITTAQVDKPLNIPDFQTRPNLIDLRVDFMVGESDEATNIGEQYKVMATMTQIIKELIDKISKLEGSKLHSVRIFPKSDDGSEEADVNSKRGKLYQAYVKKNLPSGWDMSTGKDARGGSIVLYPPLEEGFDKKLGKDPFGLNAFAYELARLDEGAYDALTTKLTRATIRKWVEDSKKKPIPKKSFVDIDIDEFDGKGREIDFNYVGLTEFTDKVDGYEVNGTSNSGEDKGKIPFVATLFKINPKVLPQAWSKISADVSDVIRHEIEHLTQAGDNTRSGKYMDDDKMIRDMIDKLKILPKSDYYKLEKEVDAMLQGLYLKAKKTRKPFADVIDQYLDIAPGIDTKEDKEIILNLWRSRRKALSLPVFETKYKLGKVMNEQEEIKTQYKIYCDMDGVLTDFDTQFEELSGGVSPREYENKNGKEAFWELISQGGVGYWVGMPWMPNGKKLWEYIAKYNPTLLSAPSRENESRLGKRLWVRNNIKPKPKLILASAANKPNYSGRDRILIDDRPDTIANWNAKGGIGILFKSTDQVIKELQELGL